MTRQTSGKTLLQINFTHHLPDADYQALTAQVAPAIAEVEGLEWKIFLTGSDRRAGGVYLFRDEAAADAYLNGPLITGLRGHPAICELQIRKSGIMESVTAVTRGPVGIREVRLRAA